MAELIVATKQIVEEIFDGAAPRYDREGPQIFSHFGARLVEIMDIAGGERVLDVATGTGAVLIPAAQRVGRFGRVVGVDLAKNMLEQADDAAREMGLDNFELYKMDAEHLEFRDGIFDVVTCAFSLFLFPAMDVALREMYRVLASGGRLGVALFGRDPVPFDPGWRLFADQVQAYGVGVRTPQRVAYAPEEAQALLAAPGFVKVETQSKVYAVVFKSAEDWWAFQFTLGNRATLLRMNDDVRARFKAEYLAKVGPLFREDGLHLGVSVIFAMGYKP